MLYRYRAGMPWRDLPERFGDFRLIHTRHTPWMLSAGKSIVIPAKRCRKEPRDYDRHLYRARHLIENFFSRLKQYRSIATRYDKTARNFLGAIYLAASVIWLN